MADHCRNFDLFFCYIDVFFWTRHSNNSGQVFCSEAEWDLEEKGKGGDCQVRTYQPTNASYFNVSRKPGRYRLGLRFLRRFWRCLRILNPHCLSPTFLLFVTLLGLSLAGKAQYWVVTAGKGIKVSVTRNTGNQIKDNGKHGKYLFGRIVRIPQLT